MRPGNVTPGKTPVTVTYPPATEGGAVRARMLPCLTCQAMASTGCLRNGHLVGEPEDCLPPLRLVRA